MFVCQLILRAADLERDQETFFGCSLQLTKFTFQATNLVDALQKANGNFVGSVKGNFLFITKFIFNVLALGSKSRASVTHSRSFAVVHTSPPLAMDCT